jgi:hypothetical protein
VCVCGCERERELKNVTKNTTDHRSSENSISSVARDSRQGEGGIKGRESGRKVEVAV